MSSTPGPSLPEHLAGGDADCFSFAVDKLRLQGGQNISLPPIGVTALVGGNNVGKSTVLRQIANWLAMESPDVSLGHPSLLTELQIAKSGTHQDFAAWLIRHAEVRFPAGQEPTVHRALGFDTTLQYAANLFNGILGNDRVGPLSRGLVHYADAKQRFAWINPVARRGAVTDPPQNPLHQLEDDLDGLSRLTAISVDIFGQTLTLDFLGSNVILRVGTPDVTAPPVDRVTAEYRSAMGRLKPLNEQGDGMCSVLGLMIPVVSATYPVLLIDEPEAFLHPPQARTLGRTLARLAQERRLQIVVATHDRNLLTGLMDEKDCPLTVVRLTRDDDTTSAEQLPVEMLRETWGDPVLRHTHVLDGLFHQLVVIAENERDCSFYAAACEAAHEVSPLPIPPHDILFLSSHGKSGMARLASALKAAGVRVAISPDLDVLRDEPELRKLVDSLGADWSGIKPFYDRATAEFRQPRKPKLNKDVLASVEAVLQENADATYTLDVKRRIDAALATESPWSPLKVYGEKAMRADRPAVTELFSRLDAANIVLVGVGELEGFGPNVVARKGQGWLPEALATGVHENAEAEAHIRRIVRQ